MNVLYVCSSESYAGKSVVCMVLGRHFQTLGMKVGYFKPVGTLPTRVGGVSTDEDAVFIAQTLGLQEPPDALCPFLLTSETMHRLLNGHQDDYLGVIDRAFDIVSKDKDIVIVGGIGSVWSTATALGLNAANMVTTSAPRRCSWGNSARVNVRSTGCWLQKPCLEMRSSAHCSTGCRRTKWTW